MNFLTVSSSLGISQIPEYLAAHEVLDFHAARLQLYFSLNEEIFGSPSQDTPGQKQPIAFLKEGSLFIQYSSH